MLGKEHPDTLTSVNNLAAMHARPGRLRRGLAALSARARGRERVLGQEHPDTLTSVNNLAVCIGPRATTAGAEPLYQRALESRERVLGKEHPDTLTSVNNLARLHQARADTARPCRSTARARGASACSARSIPTRSPA